MNASTEIRPAATLILARPAVESFELMMLKRTTKAAFASGMYVFPGGKIDASDSDPALAPYIAEPRDHQHAQIAALGEGLARSLCCGHPRNVRRGGYITGQTSRWFMGDPARKDHR